MITSRFAHNEKGLQYLLAVKSLSLSLSLWGTMKGGPSIQESIVEKNTRIDMRRASQEEQEDVMHDFLQSSYGVMKKTWSHGSLQDSCFSSRRRNVCLLSLRRKKWVGLSFCRFCSFLFHMLCKHNKLGNSVTSNFFFGSLFHCCCSSSVSVRPLQVYNSWRKLSRIIRRASTEPKKQKYLWRLHKRG